MISAPFEVWQEWDVYVRKWHLAKPHGDEAANSPPPRDGYFALTNHGQKIVYLPYPPYPSEELREQALRSAEEEWDRTKACWTEGRVAEIKQRQLDEAKRVQQAWEEKDRQTREYLAWWDKEQAERKNLPEQPKKRQRRKSGFYHRKTKDKILESKAKSAARLKVLAVHPAKPIKSELVKLRRIIQRATKPQYWPEFYQAITGQRPPIATWDPANKTYTLPKGIRIPTVQEGWQEEMEAHEAFVWRFRNRHIGKRVMLTAWPAQSPRACTK